MSASRRSLARLPLEIFEDLAPGGIPKPRTGTNGSGGSGSSRTDCEGQTVILTPEELRRTICDKLKRFRVRSAHPKFKPTSTSVTTVGDILRVSPWTLLLALDPLLTYGTLEGEFLSFVMNGNGPCETGFGKNIGRYLSSFHGII